MSILQNFFKEMSGRKKKFFLSSCAIGAGTLPQKEKKAEVLVCKDVPPSIEFLGLTLSCFPF
jgi:hypothetical protein